MKIDAHQHFWSIARNDYGWLTPELPHLWRDFSAADLAPLLTRHGIEKTILVQAAPTEAETEFLLAIADKTSFVAGVVGWIDFDAPDAPLRVARTADHPMLVGLRPMVQDIADDHWLLRPTLVPVFEAMAAHGLVFDALVLPRHLSALATVARQHPHLPIVIDHAAKPHIRDRNFDPWRTGMAHLAGFQNISCKLSGLVTEAAPGWRSDDLRPVFDHLLDIFGPSRLIWGSDWPVVTGAADYGTWFETACEMLGARSDEERDAIFGRNAASTYLNTRGRRD